MTSAIIEISDRGQITIPKKIRELTEVQRFICTFSDGKIILEPLRTVEEFWNQLEEAEKDWKKNGGLTLQEIKKKYNL